MHPEFLRLREAKERHQHWRRWGTYLSERQWGTVREDYSEDGSCWDYFSHEDAQKRAYRWGEDGLLGLCDRRCRLCFSFAFWNKKDPFLKERLFGLTGPEGNHGEDVKECYYYLDALPTHAYQRALYKYPQNEFPYEQIRKETKALGVTGPEYELIDTGIFDSNEYFDVFIEYAKGSPNDILIRATIHNRADHEASLLVLPTLWFRNAWSWGREGEGYWERPFIRLVAERKMLAEQNSLGTYLFALSDSEKDVRSLLTENETNHRALYNIQNAGPYTKDAFHRYLIEGEEQAVNPIFEGTKAAFLLEKRIAAGGSDTIELRLCSSEEEPKELFGSGYDALFQERKQECKTFYDLVCKNSGNSGDALNVSRQAYAGLVWTKQFYWYVQKEWAEGDPAQPKPSAKRGTIRNVEWKHLYNRDVISMPDKWEYPWYAAWDLAFHMLPFARIDPDYAKDQLVLMLREWYMHPNGQIPAYEFAFSDVNPPVHAWACWRVYKMTAKEGERDTVFLARCFQKLLLNFTWWVNRKDEAGKNLFSGGFLGLDNIGVFDRSNPPSGNHKLEQADATAWMAFYCGTMLSMAIELALEDKAYEDMASKFFEHFIAITDAMNTLGGTGLWDSEENFYFDMLHLDDKSVYLTVRSLVGIIPLFAVEVFQDNVIELLPGFLKRTRWFLRHRQDLAHYVSYLQHAGQRRAGLALLALPSRDRLEKILETLLDEEEFLSPYGVRSLSKRHEQDPYILKIDGQEHRVQYEPAESTSSMFGGNSNWRGPVWFPVNFLLIEALERYYYFYGEELKVECPTGSGVMMSLREVAWELSRRLSRLFLPDAGSRRAIHGEDLRYQEDPHWKDLVLFYENFHGDTGKGLGASHQTGWTALVTLCLEKLMKKNQPL